MGGAHLQWTGNGVVMSTVGRRAPHPVSFVGALLPTVGSTVDMST